MEIHIKFNTKEKTLSVTADGKAIADVVEAYCARHYDDDKVFGCNVITATEDKDNGTRTYTRLCASDGAEGQAVLRAGGSEKSPVDGFVVAGTRSKVEEDIAAFFGRKD